MPINNEILSEDNFRKVRDKFHAPDENYQILRGERQAVRGKQATWDQDYTLERYAQATDHVIGLADGSIRERAVGYGDKPEFDKPDTVIYLDKSARPVEWLVDAFWDQYAKEGVSMPSSEFLNIDRVNWFIREGYDATMAERRLGPEDFHVEKVPRRDIARIRALFVEGEFSDHDNWEQEVWGMPTRLDGREVLIIDEVKNKGGTLAIACQLLKAAIPEARFSGDYFWPDNRYAIDTKGDEKQQESVPLWYDNLDPFGRGVGDIRESYYNDVYENEPTDDNFKRKLGAHVLSAPHVRRHRDGSYEPVRDVQADRLKQDIAYMTYDADKIFRSPSRKRNMEDLASILKKNLPEGITLRQLAQYRERRSKENSK